MNAALGLGIAAALASGSIEWGRTAHGSVYWHGHRVEPPYVVTLDFKTNPDTTWTGISINGLSLEPVSDRPITPRPGMPGPDTMARALEESVAAAGGHVPYTARLASELRSHGEAVDSVTVAGPNKLLVHWRGISVPMGVTVGGPDSTVAFPRERPAPDAGRIVRLLEQGGLLVVSGGLTFVPSGADEYVAEIESLRAGLPALARHVNRMERAEFLHPEPIDSLRARQSR